MTAVREYVQDVLFEEAPKPVWGPAAQERALVLVEDVEFFLSFHWSWEKIADRLGVQKASLRKSLRRARDIGGITHAPQVPPEEIFTCPIPRKSGRRPRPTG